MNNTLADWMDKKKVIHQPARVLLQITELLSDIHSRGKVHGSLSPLSVILDSNGLNVTSIEATIITNDVSQMKEFLNEWRPAEENDSAPPSKEGDIFSLGCLFNFVLSNGERHPFGKSRQRALFIANNLYDVSGCDDVQLQNLIVRMISHSSKNRPLCEDVKKHPFLWTDEKVDAYLFQLINNVDLNSDQYKEWTRKILFTSEKNSKKNTKTVTEILTEIKVIIKLRKTNNSFII